MSDKVSKTIPEYAIRKWMRENQFVMSVFSLEVDGNAGVITDRNGEKMSVKYDPDTKEVSEIKEKQ